MLFDKFKNKEPERDEDIIVLSEPDPLACGGTTATRNLRAPKEIVSENMISFSVEESLRYMSVDEENPLMYIYAYAVKAGEKTFLYLKKEMASDYDNPTVGKRMMINKDYMPELVKLVNDFKLAENNGFHSTTHGLPDNFGGTIDVNYESGERISISDNQSEVISYEASKKIVEIFEAAFSSDDAYSPDLSELSELPALKDLPYALSREIFDKNFI